MLLKTLSSQFRAVLLLASALTILPTIASAMPNVSDTLQVSLEIKGSCSMTAGKITFIDAQSGFVGDLKSQASITSKCSSGLSYQVQLSNGLNAVASQRYMKHTNGSDKVAYNLYSDATLSNKWSDTCVPLATSIGTGLGAATAAGCRALKGSGANQITEVYGQVSGISASNAIGTYSDTVTATIIF